MRAWASIPLSELFLVLTIGQWTALIWSVIYAGDVADLRTIHIPRIRLHGLKLWQNAFVEGVR